SGGVRKFRGGADHRRGAWQHHRPGQRAPHKKKNSPRTRASKTILHHTAEDLGKAQPPHGAPRSGGGKGRKKKPAPNGTESRAAPCHYPWARKNTTKARRGGRKMSEFVAGCFAHRALSIAHM